MRLLHLLVAGIALGTFMASVPAHALSTGKLSRRVAGGNDREGRRSSSFYEVEFSDVEESVLKASQGETLEGLSRMLGGRSIQEIERRCVELGLRCGQGATAPAKNSEKWRARARNG